MLPRFRRRSAVKAIPAPRLPESALLVIPGGIPLVIIFLLTRHFVTVPLDNLQPGLEDIARGEGDLTRRLPVRGQDEVGQGRWYSNEMMENFQRSVRQVC